MSGLGVSQESRNWGSPVLVRALDESIWQTWVASGRARERRNNAARSKVLTWLAIVGLIAGAAIWSHLAPYDVVLRFVVAIAAFVVMFQAAQAKRYGLAAAFATLVVVYNPIAPPLRFSGDWQRALVAASSLPFAASLGWLNTRTERHG